MTKKTFKDSAAIQFISDADKKDKTEEQLEISELHENIGVELCTGPLKVDSNVGTRLSHGG